ncbi:helix-turn-helix domain-containing protein [Streptomyces lydicus]|uniref:helix-turn-helix domain-containing protein n=1 Tax=Streptomyces lydicus TaxID=47763 RepID=UPI0013DDD202
MTEIAELVGVTANTVSAWCRTEALAAHRVGGRWIVPEPLPEYVGRTRIPSNAPRECLRTRACRFRSAAVTKRGTWPLREVVGLVTVRDHAAVVCRRAAVVTKARLLPPRSIDLTARCIRLGLKNVLGACMAPMPARAYSPQPHPGGRGLGGTHCAEGSGHEGRLP